MTPEALAAAVNGPAGVEEVRRARAWLWAPLLDASRSFASVILVTLLRVTLGAQVLRPEHAVPEGNKLLDAQE